MLTSTLVFTDHAVVRMSQRNLDDQDVEYVCKYGIRFIRAGALHIFLGSRNIPIKDQCNDRFNRLIGTTILIDSHDKKTVLTVYRNRESLKKDRRKSKYNYRISMHQQNYDQLPLAI